MPNFSVVVQGPSGPIAGARVVVLTEQLTGRARYTDGGGFSNFYSGPALTPPIIFDVMVDAAGFAPWTTSENDHSSVIFGATDVTLTAKLTPSFRLPSRSQACAVKAAFQGLRVTLPGYGEVPNVGGFINSLDSAGRQLVRQAERAAGATHGIRQISYAYNDGGYVYPIPGADFTNDLATFRTRCLEDLASGIIPVVFLCGDGMAHDPNGGTYGWPWLHANLERILKEIDLPIPYCHSWEELNYNGWDDAAAKSVGLNVGTDLLFDLTLQHLSLDSQAVICWHSGYAWPGDGTGATGGPIGAWSSKAGRACSVFLEEGNAPFMAQELDGTWRPTVSPQENDYADGWQQKAACHLGPAANLAMILPKNREPFYWVEPTLWDVPRVAVALELDEYRDDRNQVSLEEIRAEQTYCRNIGFASVA